MRTDDATETSEPRSRLGALTRLISSHVWRARPTTKHRRWQAITLIALCLAVYVPGLFTIPPIDRDESRFAQASRQMFESIALPEAQRDPAMHSGELAVPYVIDNPRLNKPPLIYWIQTASAATFTLGNPLNDAIWMYRLPSAIFATLTVLMTWRIGLLLFDARAAWLGAATLAICPLVVIDAHQGRADQLMVACTTAAMWALAGIVKHSRTREVPFRLAIGLAIAVAAGVLAKGPITPMVVVLAIIAYAVLTRRFRWIIATHPWLTVLVTAITIGPWIYFVARHFGFAEYKALVFDETIGRSAAPKEGHWGPPGYHLLLLPVLFWPGSLGVALGFVHVFRRRVGWRPARWQEAFLIAWIVPAWIVFELVSTKLPHYTMPMYPAVALLCARALCSGQAVTLIASSRVIRTLMGFWYLIPVVLAFAFYVASLSLEAKTFVRVMLTMCSLLIATTFAIGIIFAYSQLFERKGQHIRGLLLVAGVWVFAIANSLQVAVPNLNTLSKQIVTYLNEQEWDGTTVILGDYQEDSLVFLLRGRAERAGGDAPRRASQDPDQPVVLGSNQLEHEYAWTLEGNSLSRGPAYQVQIIMPSSRDPK